MASNGWYHEHKGKTEPVEAKQKIEAVLIETLYYGYKRVTKQLQRDQSQASIQDHGRISPPASEEIKEGTKNYQQQAQSHGVCQ